ncbi:MAG: carboxypeptidase regulatory-like domain-containing protein [Xanthomonadales bacterium]|nr:carboxypeptidase regulatory-like domain-containing protein [Xanthomonadales bacterium]
MAQFSHGQNLHDWEQATLQHLADAPLAEQRLLQDRLRTAVADASAKGDVWRAGKLDALLRLAQSGPGWTHPLAPGQSNRSLQLSSAINQCSQAAVLESGEVMDLTTPAGSASSDLWFGFTAPAAGLYIATTLGSEGDSQLDLWQSCGLREGEWLASNDDHYGLHAVVPIQAARAGQQFSIRFRNAGPLRRDRISVVEGGYLVSGTVSSSAGPPDSLQVTATTPSGIYGGETSVNPQDGSYQLIVIRDDPVLVRTTSFRSPSIMVAHPGQSCFDPSTRLIASCGEQSTLTRFTPDQAPYANVDFDLPLGGRVVGNVTDRQTGAGIFPAEVHLRMVGSNVDLHTTTTTGQGRYDLVGLFPGQYTLLARRSFGYRAQLHQGIDCDFPSGCDHTLGTVIESVPGSPELIDFDLQPSARLTVEVTGVAANDFVSLYLIVDASELVGPYTAISDANGIARVLVEQAAGPFRFLVRASTIVSQVFPDIRCTLPSCQGQFLDGQSLTMPADGNLTVPISVTARPRLDGQLRDAQFGLPISNARMELKNADQFVTPVQATTDDDGNFQLRNAYPGEYRLHAISDRHIDELYPNTPCEAPQDSCAGFELVMIGIDGAPAVSMDLNPSGAIRGRVSAVEGLGQPAVYVNLLDLNGNVVGNASALSGSYEVSDVLPGSYRIGAYWDFFPTPIFPVLYNGIRCERAPIGQPIFSACPQVGDVLNVTVGTEIENIDFEVEYVNARSFRVQRGDTLEPLANVVLDYWSDSGQYIAAVVTDASGTALISATQSQTAIPFLLSTSNTQGLVDEVYDDIACPDGPAFFGFCSLSGAAPIQSQNPAPGTPPLSIRLLPVGSDALWVDGFE